ncbi:hypothetical protein GAL49_00555 [Salmonella enterica subsp. enterica serovar Enteritidis]|nr:hypothetical protein [Salmonella enterica subsp. enterica serovar Enteritidis]
MPAWRVLREIVCRISGCKSTEFAQRHGREGIKLMGQKFFDIHESSRFNMSFKCSGEFNIIYIMRTNGKDGRNWLESLTLGVDWLLSAMIQNHPFLQTNQNRMSVNSK